MENEREQIVILEKAWRLCCAHLAMPISILLQALKAEKKIGAWRWGRGRRREHLKRVEGKEWESGRCSLAAVLAIGPGHGAEERPRCCHGKGQASHRPRRL